MAVLLLINFLTFLYFIFTGHYDRVPVLINLATIAITAIYVLKDTIKINKIDLIIVGILFAVALFLRLYKLEELPPGMYGDEVTVARTALKQLQNPEITPFRADDGHPTPIMYYGVGSSITILGRNLTAIRLPMVIFGALGVVIFYFFLRLLFPTNLAAAGAFLLCFSYPDITLSRLTYEAILSLFCQVLAFLFFFATIKTGEWQHAIAFGLALGFGFYTYLNFRPFALFFLPLALYLLGIKKTPYVFIGLFIAISWLLSYAIIHPSDLWSRAGSISVFNYGLPNEEIIKEIWGAGTRILGSWGIVADPNPGKSPAGVAVFDPFLSLFAATGMIFLFLKKRQVFLIIIVCAAAAIVSDIFSLERIPEFHYYGLGHPNTPRISGLIPLTILTAVYGLSFLKKDWLIIGATVLLCALGGYFYFWQKEINPRWYAYNYVVNQQPILEVIDKINKNNILKIDAPKKFWDNERVDFFLNKNVIQATDGAKVVISDD